MQTIVVTGSTRGIGFGLADSFLALGCAVTISGRTDEAVKKGVEKLVAKYDAGRVLGHACDVRDPDQIRALWQFAKSHWGHVDIWINNAGQSNTQGMAWELSPAHAKSVVESNLLGAIYGSQVAIQGMLEQGYGSIYNMEGMGSDGRMHPGLILYGTTKYGLNYFTRGLVKESQHTPLVIGAIRPGMVVTDLITRQYDDRPEDWERAKRIFNIIAERVETVTPWLAERILKNQKSGACISRVSRWKLLLRFLLAPIRKRDLFDEGE